MLFWNVRTTCMRSFVGNSCRTRWVVHSFKRDNHAVFMDAATVISISFCTVAVLVIPCVCHTCPPPPSSNQEVVGGSGEIHWNYLNYTKTMVMPVHSPPCMVWLVDSRGPSCHRPWCSNSSPKWVVLTVLILLHCICVVSSTAPLQSVVPNCHDTTNTLRVQWVCSFADPSWIYVVQLLLWHLRQWNECCLRLLCRSVFGVCMLILSHVHLSESLCVFTWPWWHHTHWDFLWI